MSSSVIVTTSTMEEITERGAESGSDSPNLKNNKSRRSRTSSYDSKSENKEKNDGSELLVKVPIVGFETMEERAKFTVFKLRVENEKLDETWLVFRRYTDFVRLHSKLKEEIANLQICLPPKRWLRDNFETAFLEERMKGLQAFVDSILVQPQLAELHTVRKFFCLDEPPVYSDSAEESRSWYGTLEDSSIMLKHKLSEKDREIELLRTELALVTTQRDNVIKLAKNCRHCSQKQVCSSPRSGRNSSNHIGSPRITGIIPSSSSSSDHDSSSPRRSCPIQESQQSQHSLTARNKNSPTSSRRSSNTSSNCSPSHTSRRQDNETALVLNEIPEDNLPTAATSSSSFVKNESDKDKEESESILSVTIHSSPITHTSSTRSEPTHFDAANDQAASNSKVLKEDSDQGVS